MKQLIKFMFAAAALVAAFASCEKPQPAQEDPKTLTLEATKLVINNDGEDKAVFTVRYGNDDVTADATFEVDGVALNSENGNGFGSTELGKYKVVAKYNDQTSNEVTIEVKDLVNALVLTADKDIIEPDGVDEVHFTVTQGGVDVTDRVQICATGDSGICLGAPVFSTTTIGEHTFYSYFTDDMANPDHLVSNEFTVTAIEIEDTGARYLKNVAFFTFTATWCGPCYRYKETLHALEADYGERLVTVSLYSDSNDTHGGSDPIVKSEITGLFREEIIADGRHPNIWGWPNTMADLDLDFASSGKIPREGQARAAYATYSANPAKTGIKASSRVEGPQVNVSVEIAAGVTGRYYIGALLLEDDIVAPQYQNTNPPASYVDGYSHTDVLRDKAMTGVYGDDLGVIAGGEIATKTISFNIDSKYVAANLEVVIYTLYTKDGHRTIENSVKLPANGSIDYIPAE